ncbi:DUF2913 family protein [Morganella morganii subsp. sibonii]
MNAEEKNQHLGRMAFCALVALKLAQADGKTGCSLQAENIFLVRWLQTALKQKRFHRCVAGDLVWLSGHGRRGCLFICRLPVTEAVLPYAGITAIPV